MAIERNEFLRMCQKVSVLKNGICGVKENVPDELKVIYNGIAYYPVSYELACDNWKPTHTAILHDLKANSITNADLGKVIKYEP